MRTPLNRHRELAAWADREGRRAPPRRPVPGECCDRGCDPCVWDYYERALAQWQDTHAPDAPEPEASPATDA
ncbi:MAG: oxidoreductase-like domain-containing protein [Myxococcota bacterium]